MKDDRNKTSVRTGGESHRKRNPQRLNSVVRNRAAAVVLSWAAVCGFGLALPPASLASSVHTASAEIDDSKAVGSGSGSTDGSARESALSLSQFPNPELGQESGAAFAAPTQTLIALERGLAYLALRQLETDDGSLPTAKPYIPVSVTALSSLAWMAAGSCPDRGPYGAQVGSGVDYLLRQEGYEKAGYISAGSDRERMHAHGFATLALTQAFSTPPSSPRGRQLSERLERCVGLIEATQGLEGGWWYQPEKVTKHENSITISMVQALRSARNIGLSVDARVIARATDYVKRCQNEENGSFRYALDEDRATIAITAAGISTLNAIGEYQSREIQNGIDWIQRKLTLRAEEESSPAFPYYERLYLAQAFWQNPDPRLFERWYAEEWPRILESQKQDGSWTDTQHGSCYATAVNCLVLALPLNQLPAFER